MTKPNTECPNESSIFTVDAQGKYFPSNLSVHIADLWGFFKCSYVPSKLIASSNLLGSKKAALAKTKSIMVIFLQKAIQTLCIKAG